MHADHRYLWPLLLLSFYSTLVDFVRADPLPIPKTYWFDITCLRKGLNDANIKESVQMASAGASRLLNENDRYQSWVYQKLLNRIRDTRVITPTQTWKVVEIEGWIGSMTNRRGNLFVARDVADVRVYCDDDARWTRVPDDEASAIAGLPVNSRRAFGISQEWEDTLNYMRRDPTEEGCKRPDTYGVTYTTPMPFDPNSRGTRVPENYHSFRQTVTVCDLAFDSDFQTLGELEAEDWENLEIFTLEGIPTVVLLYQFLTLNNYRLSRGVDPAESEGAAQAWQAAEDSWQAVITRPPGGIGFVTNPGPYLWNAILAFAASKGWALRPGLSQEQLEAGNELFFNDVRLQNLAFQCPRLMPNQQSVNLPQWLRSLCAVTG